MMSGCTAEPQSFAAGVFTQVLLMLFLRKGRDGESPQCAGSVLRTHECMFVHVFAYACVCGSELGSEESKQS